MSEKSTFYDDNYGRCCTCVYRKRKTLRRRTEGTFYCYKNPQGEEVRVSDDYGCDEWEEG